MNKTYGLLLETQRKYDTVYVTARVVCREGDAPHPQGCPGFRWEYGGKLAQYELDGLGLHGFVSDMGDPAYIGYEPVYRDVHTVDLGKAKRMAKTLDVIQKKIHRDEAREAGDVLVALMEALKLSWAVKQASFHPHSSSYSDNKWMWSNGTHTARNAFRDMIHHAIAEVSEKKRVA